MGDLPQIVGAPELMPQIANLNAEEKQLFYDIVRSATKSDGTLDLQVLQELWEVDYDEVPVSIDRFISDPHYLGGTFDNGALVYPFWKEVLHDVFHNNPDKAFELCLTGDTRIPLLDGTEPTIKELYESGNQKFNLYSYDMDLNEYTVGQTSNIMYNGKKPVYEITLDNGKSFRVTDNHKILLRNKVWKSLSSGLSVGDSLMPFERELDEKGYEQVRHPKKDGTSQIESTHRFVNRWKNLTPGNTRWRAVHHKDFNRRNNDPSNLCYVHYKSHIRYHSKRQKQNFEVIGEYIRGRMSEGQKMVDRNKDVEYQDNCQRGKILSSLNKLNSQTAIVSATNYRDLLKSLGEKRVPSLERIVKYFGSFEYALQESRTYNHKIVSIEYVGVEDVYDLTVDRHHNFAISAGCVVHNCITGAIGIGKSTVATIALTYLIYRTLCLKNPQKFYGLTANSPIVFMVFNLTLELAYSGLYSMIVESIRTSPWFKKHVDIRGKYEFTIEFPKGISLMAGSQTTHSIGKNVLGAVLDEVNFGNAPKGSKNSIMDLYKNIRRRLESRFLKAGRIPGLLMMVSSKNSEMDFLEQYINSIKYLKTTIVIDKPIYEIKPPSTYTGEKFSVAVGDKTKMSKIIPEGDSFDTYEQQGYKIIHVPVEYKSAFQQDINEALKDISGISSVSTNKLIPYPGKIQAITDYNRQSPLMMEQLHLGLDSPESIRDFISDISLLKRDLHLPRFAHVDIGLKGDALGLALVHSDKQTQVDRYNPNGGVESVIENSYRVDLLLSIKALAGSEVPLFKVREFLMWLSTEVGFKIQAISYDGYQSADSIQLLKVAGYNAVLQSLDRNDKPYLNLRSAIIEGRLSTYYHSILERELYDLEHDKRKEKVDHPLEGADGQPGTKDLSDGLCGAVWQAQNYYATQKSTRMIQHTNVKNALTALQTLAKQRATDPQEDTSWL